MINNGHLATSSGYRRKENQSAELQHMVQADAAHQARRQARSTFVFRTRFFQDWLNDHIDVVIDAARLAGIGEINVIYITEKIPAELRVAVAGQSRFRIHRQYAESEIHVRHVSSSAHRISLRTPQHWPWRRNHRRPTTHCFCMAVWVWVKHT